MMDKEMQSRIDNTNTPTTKPNPTTISAEDSNGLPTVAISSDDLNPNHNFNPTANPNLNPSSLDYIKIGSLVYVFTTNPILNPNGEDGIYQNKVFAIDNISIDSDDREMYHIGGARFYADDITLLTKDNEHMYETQLEYYVLLRRYAQKEEEVNRLTKECDKLRQKSQSDTVMTELSSIPEPINISNSKDMKLSMYKKTATTLMELVKNLLEPDNE